MPGSDQRRPNVLFIMDDQHRYDYLGSAGAEFVSTPNLDRLAERGVRFTHCCSNAPVCAPARTSLASGLNPWRLGAYNNDVFLPASRPTLYKHFRDHGYRVGCVGKLDLAKPDGYNGLYGDRPRTFQWGFTHPEECEGKAHAGRKPVPQGPYGRYLHEKGLLERFHLDYKARNRRRDFMRWIADSALPTEDFEDCYIGRRSAQFIENIPDDFPWFLFVSFVGPHIPFDPPTEYAERYRNADMPDPIPMSREGKPNWIQKRQEEIPTEHIKMSRRQYCAAIEVIDDQVGLILDALERRGELENTIVVFTSDHGEFLGDHGMYAKTAPHEPALRVPLIVAGPGIPQGVTSDALIELFDLNPTVTELAGLPAQPGLDARSFADVVTGKRTDHRAEVVSFLRQFRMLRDTRYKYIDNVNDIPELYDLHEDPGEERNIAERLPDVVEDMRARLNKRMIEGDALR